MQQAPLFRDVAACPAGGAAYWLRASDGVRIRIGIWTGGDKGTILLLPGRTEYIEKYGQAAGEFISRGYSVVVLDYRGQGLADRLLSNPHVGHVGAFSDYQLDIQATLDVLPELGLGGPLYLIGHSQGGGLGLRTLMDSPDTFKAAAFSAPMWGILMPAPLRLIAPAIAAAASAIGLGNRFAPNTNGATPYVLAAGFEGNTLTHDPAMWDYMRRQILKHSDLTLGGPSFAWVGRALEECKALAARPSPDVPTLTFLGDKEAIVDPKAVHTRMENWPNGTLELVDTCQHELMMETPPIRTRFFDDVTAHFSKHG